ncbi:hypothetical protein EJB05_32930, partial [Eragrostis curvula]
MAAIVMEEYEANGYIEHLDAEDFELTPELHKLIWKIHSIVQCKQRSSLNQGEPNIARSPVP